MIVLLFALSYAISFGGVLILSYKSYVRVRKYLLKLDSMEFPLPDLTHMEVRDE